MLGNAFAVVVLILKKKKTELKYSKCWVGMIQYVLIILFHTGMAQEWRLWESVGYCNTVGKGW